VISKQMVKEAKRRFNEIREAQEGVAEDIFGFNALINVEQNAMYELFETDVILTALGQRHSQEAQMEISTAIGRLTGFHIGVLAARLEAAAQERAR
jgi:hypothetical protein